MHPFAGSPADGTCSWSTSEVSSLNHEDEVEENEMISEEKKESIGLAVMEGEWIEFRLKEDENGEQ